MTNPFHLYNTLTRKKEEFQPLNPPFVGLYACGPTVYGDAHLGHARQAITFDVLYRALMHFGYKVRYIRNITDVGHLEDDADEGEDKVLKKARLESLEPMEVVQHYMNRYHENMRELNVLPPSIEPRASGHMIEQQELIGRIMDAGYAYESNGSVYFDVEKYNRKHPYGILSGRKVEDLRANTRELEGQSEKRAPFDFSLWKKAGPAHIMRWPSPWGEGFPGWHLECSAMSTKYLGLEFDIHGGGMDLLFPHHECEIAQNVAGNGKPAVKYWMHNNMITVNGKKMGRSLGNFITLEQFFSGDHELLDGACDPMTIRFFILQAHYRNPLDFSIAALRASEKGLARLISLPDQIGKLPLKPASTAGVDELVSKCESSLRDDLNTPVLIAHLFDGVKLVSAIADGTLDINRDGREKLHALYHHMLFDILGLKARGVESGSSRKLTSALVEMILRLRKEARDRKDFAESDRLRDELEEMGISIKDTKEGTDWEIS